MFSTFIPRVVYFGLKNALPFFQHMIAKEFALLLQKYEPYLSNYLDNWIIAMPEEEEGLKLHWSIMHEFLELMEKLSYFLKLGKCEFKTIKTKFLGWLITKEGVTMDPLKASGLANWPQKLHNLKELRWTLGILGY